MVYWTQKMLLPNKIRCEEPRQYYPEIEVAIGIRVLPVIITARRHHEYIFGGISKRGFYCLRNKFINGVFMFNSLVDSTELRSKKK